MSFFRLMASDDKGVPSSSRVIGAWIFFALVVSLIAITTVFLWKIVVTVDTTNLTTVVTALTKFAWLYLVLAATALSLYGINVWKYVAQLRSAEFGQIAGALPRMVNPTPLVQSVTGLGGSTGKAVIPTQQGLPVEPHTDPIPPKVHTTVAGVGSDD